MLPHEHSLDYQELAKHTGWVHRLARELVRDRSTADELVQETWLAFLRNRPTTNRPLRPWLAKVLRSQAALFFRKNDGRGSREKSVARTEQLPSTYELLERAENGRRLVGMVLDLEEPYRSTLLLHFFETLTPKQIGLQRGVPSATVRTHLRRGIIQLRERMTAENDGNERAWVLALLPLARVAPAPGLILKTSLAGILLLAMTVALTWFGADSSSRVYPQADNRVTTSFIPEQEVLLASKKRKGAVAPAVIDSAERETRAGSRVQLVAEGDGATLPGYFVRAEDKLLVSDADGWITVDPLIESIVAVNHEGQELEVAVSHIARTMRNLTDKRPRRVLTRSGANQVALPTGPCFELDVEGPRITPTLFDARLVPAGQSPYADGARTRQVAALRPPGFGFEHPWVRFSGAPEGDGSGVEKWCIEVRSRDGLWWGSAAVDNARAGEAQQVGVRLISTAVLECWPTESAVDALLVLRDQKRATHMLKRCDDGHYELRWIEPGAYQLTLHSSRLEPFSRTIDFLGGERRILDIPLVPLSIGGAIEGRVLSQSGTYNGQLLVFLFDQDGRVIDVFPTTWRREGVDAAARFRFEEVPEGPCTVDVVALDSAVTIVGALPVVSPPEEAMEIVLRDRDPAADWSLEVVDAVTGEALAPFAFEVSIDGGPARIYHHSSNMEPPWRLEAGGSGWNRFPGEAPLRSMPEDTRFQWKVRCAGFTSLSGDASDFETVGPGERQLKIMLHPAP